MQELRIPLRFPVLNSGQILEIAPNVLKKFASCRQLQKNDQEAGGVLLATIETHIIRVQEISTPSDEDKRSRTSYEICSERRSKIAKAGFSKGLHFIGEWHTHPEGKPKPSALDLKSMRDSYRQSSHELNYFVMVIVGNSKLPLSLWISIHNGEEFYRLDPECNLLDS